MTTSTIPQTVLFPDLFARRTFDRRHARPMAAPSCSRRRSACMGWWRVSPGVWWTVGSPGRPAHAGGVARTDLRHCLRSSRGTRQPSRRRPDPQAAARAGSPARRWPRSRRSLVRERRWPVRPLRAGARAGCGSSSGISAGWTGGRGGSRSTWIDDATHGAQQLTFFNGTTIACYLPLLAFLTFDKEQTYLCAAAARQCAGHPRECGRVVPAAPLLRQAFPQARLVRLDGGFATPEIRPPGCRATARLRGGDGQERRVAAPRRARPARGAAQSAASGQTARLRRTRYRARTWDRDRRVVIKAEVVRSATASRATTRASS